MKIPGHSMCFWGRLWLLSIQSHQFNLLFDSQSSVLSTSNASPINKMYKGPTVVVRNLHFMPHHGSSASSCRLYLYGKVTIWRQTINIIFVKNDNNPLLTWRFVAWHTNIIMSLNIDPGQSTHPIFSASLRCDPDISCCIRRIQLVKHVLEEMYITSR